MCSFIRTGKALHGMMIALFKVSHAPPSQNCPTIYLYLKLCHLRSNSPAISPTHVQLLQIVSFSNNIFLHGWISSVPGVVQYMVVYQFILGEINCAAFFLDGSSISNLQVNQQSPFQPVLSRKCVCHDTTCSGSSAIIRNVHTAWARLASYEPGS